MTNLNHAGCRRVTLADIRPLLETADDWTKGLFANSAATLLGFPKTGPIQFAAAVWQNAYHDHALYFNVVGQGSWFPLLLTKLKKMAGKHDRLQFSTYTAASPLTQQLQWAGFELIRHTAMSHYRKLAAATSNDTVVARSQLSEAQWQAVVRLSYQNYVDAHTANPATMTQTQFEQSLREADPNQPSFLVEGGTILAYVFWFEDEPGELTSAWLGGTGLADTLRLMRAVLPRLQAAFSMVNGEFDDTDSFAWAVYQQLAVPDPHPLMTWQMKLD